MLFYSSVWKNRRPTGFTDIISFLTLSSKRYVDAYSFKDKIKNMGGQDLIE